MSRFFGAVHAKVSLEGCRSFCNDVDALLKCQGAESELEGLGAVQSYGEELTVLFQSAIGGCKKGTRRAHMYPHVSNQTLEGSGGRGRDMLHG